MSLNFLAKMESHPLPYRTNDVLELVHIEILSRAGLIVADAPSPATGGWALIHSVTPLGSKLLEKGAPLLHQRRTP